ncbi:dipeptidase PepV [Salinibacillus xinjiangensis]|uniref:dipeptidase PepV n=1 Tax=Salinibacillus xinjiangensis TaxID=1229268 RepID=UPI002B270D20|nr:dipeptidase PepV [Salinibacillus xinjiangensis]
MRDGKIFARGAIDDKGPTMAAFYGLKIVKELGLPLQKNVRIIFGTDEESGMSCMRHYKEVGEMPKVGFAPDADFPIIHAEKGQINTKIGLPTSDTQHEESDLELVSIVSGDRINMVPEQATAVVRGNLGRIQDEFVAFCQEQGVQQSSNQKGDEMELIILGKAAHGMEPQIGVNAGTTLATFLKTYKFEPNTKRFIEFLSDLHKDFEGKDLGIAYQDEITGPLTVNPGVIHVDSEDSYVRLNIRCPVTTDYDEIIGKLKKSIDDKELMIEELRQSRPHHVDGDDSFIQALQKAYKDETGMEPTLLSTGGGTYARFMEKGVAYGASFPGKEMTAHQKDEYIEVEDLLKATAIYARAIYEMAR